MKVSGISLLLLLTAACHEISAFVIVKPGALTQPSWGNRHKHIAIAAKLDSPFTPPKPHTDYAIGIDLTADHAAVSMITASGAITDIGVVPASSSYSQMVQRLSQQPLSLQNPTLTTHSSRNHGFASRPRQNVRRQRKEQGIPASEDVLTIAELLRAAREEVESYLWSPISGDVVQVTVSRSTTLRMEDIEDALDFAGLNNTWAPHEPVYSELAAVISSGYGVCQPLTVADTDLHSWADQVPKYNLSPAMLSKCLSSNFPPNTSISALSMIFSSEALTLSPIQFSTSALSLETNVSLPIPSFVPSTALIKEQSVMLSGLVSKQLDGQTAAVTMPFQSDVIVRFKSALAQTVKLLPTTGVSYTGSSVPSSTARTVFDSSNPKIPASLSSLPESNDDRRSDDCANKRLPCHDGKQHQHVNNELFVFTNAPTFSSLSNTESAPEYVTAMTNTIRNTVQAFLQSGVQVIAPMPAALTTSTGIDDFTSARGGAVISLIRQAEAKMRRQREEDRTEKQVQEENIEL